MPKYQKRSILLAVVLSLSLLGASCAVQETAAPPQGEGTSSAQGAPPADASSTAPQADGAGKASKTDNKEATPMQYPQVTIKTDTNYSMESYDESKNNFKNAETFEGEAIPEGWSAGAGELSLSTRRQKNGKQSLYWRFSGNAPLTAAKLKNIDKADASKNGGIRGWIYNETPSEGKLTFEFGSGADLEAGNPRYRFEMNLNFKGWRAFAVGFKAEGLNKAYSGSGAAADTMRILPPENGAGEGVYLDLVECVQTIVWSRSADYQIPLSRRPNNGGKGGTWDRNYYYSQMQPEIKLEETITEEEKRDLDIIAGRYERWLVGEDPDLETPSPLRVRNGTLQSYIEGGKKKFDGLRIAVSDDGVITGAPLFSSRASYGPKFGTDVGTNVFFPLALDYKINGNQESLEKVMLLFDYFNDQGWADGSGIETLDHETLRLSGYFHTVYLLREELKESGRYEREMDTVKWYTCFGKTFTSELAESTADDLRTYSMYRLLYVLAMDDTPEKVQYMKGFVQWMDTALSIQPNFGGTIKPDYTGFHHRGVYGNAYAPQAFHLSSVVSYLCHGTQFSLSAKSQENLKGALETMFVLSNKYDVPTGLCGRFPDKNAITHEILPAYMYMALSGDEVDEKMAGMFMSLWDPQSDYLKNGLFPRAGANIVYYDTLGDMQMMLDFASKGYRAAETPSGFWMKPYAATAVQRRDGWSAAAKGWSQYVWDFEAGSKTENMLGRYISYGSLQLITGGEPVSVYSSGYNLAKGWDWNRWPGTTAIRLPYEQLSYLNTNNTHRTFSDETFVGGVGLEGENGMFAMKLHDTYYNTSFRANKSMFFFGNEIVCLGSDIVNDDKEHPTETTLFQSFLPKNSVPNCVGDVQGIAELPYTYQGKAGESVWLTDPYGNGYYLPDGAGLTVTRDVQQSLDQAAKSPTTGSYATAVLGHGAAPAGAGYEYAILVQATPEETAAYSEAPGYEVLRRDGRAHIVRHRESATTGYALFDASLTLEDGAIAGADTPCMVMAKQEGDTLVLSLADPDLHLPKNKTIDGMDEKTVLTPAQPSKVHLTLHGAWNLQGETQNVRSSSSGSGTVLEFDCINGMGVEVSLLKQ